MVFWGIEVKPGKPYAHSFEEWKGYLHVSMAALGLGSATSKSILQCNVGNKSPIFLCYLLPEKTECLPLNLEFAEVEEVVFSVIGPRSIHLSGFHHRPRGSPNEDSESLGLNIADTESDESGHSDDNYGGSFINDDEPEMLSDSSGDESLDEKKPKKNIKGNKKRRLRKAYEASSESEEEPLSPAFGISSGDEDTFSLSKPFNSKKGARNIKNASKAKVETLKKKTKDHVGEDRPIRENVHTEVERVEDNNAKEVEGEAKVGDIVEDQQMTKIRDQSESAHKDCERPKKKKRKENGHKSAERPEKRKKGVSKHDSSNLVNDIEEGKEKQDEAKDEQNKAAEVKESKRKMNKKSDSKASNVSTLQNGLIIEQLELGESDAKVAVAGKKISVHYDCTLKSTGREVGSKSVKFRLGARKVTEGWEDGLEGMRVGEKRRLTVPPLMGATVKVGDGEKVPQDSWLVYEVELVNVK